MKITQKLKITGRRAWLARLVILLVLVFLLMFLIKGLYVATNNNQFLPIWYLNNGLEWLIEKTYFFPLDTLWKVIPLHLFSDGDIIAFYKMLILPLVLITVSALFIADHSALKAKYRALKAEIQDEIDKRDLRKDAGLESVSGSTASIDIVVEKAENNDPAWHNKWWGKIVIGVAIGLILFAIGLS